MAPLVTRKYFSAERSTPDAAEISRADVGPCTDSAATSSVVSSTFTRRPAAFCRNQRRFGSAAVQRQTCSSSRVTVPSSITRPRSSHHGV